MKNWKVFLVLAVFVGTLATSCQKDTACQETTNDGRACKADFDPVCGCNNKTYSNSCEAEGFGITDYKQGACK
jgi:Kazal-type serine protease inhibitor domain